MECPAQHRSGRYVRVWDVTPTGPAAPGSRRHAVKHGALVVARLALLLALMFGAYFLIPAKQASDGSDWPWLLLELLAFGLIVAVQVPFIVKAKYPVLRAVEVLGLVVPLYLLIFARIYLANSLGDPTSFTQPLDKVTALYFTVTVFATVGFGDIVAQTNGMRLLVTVQMLLNLVVFGAVIRLVTAAARRGVARRGALAQLDP